MSTARPSLSDLLQRNKQYVATIHKPRPYFSELAAAGAPKPTTLLLTCADPRVAPEVYLQLDVGEVVTMRTAGGRVEPVLEDILALNSYFGHGVLKQILIIHHTDCGASHIEPKAIRTDILSRHPDAQDQVNKMFIGAFSDLDQSIKDDVAIIKNHPMLHDDLKRGTKGLCWDVKTGELREVV